MNGVENNQGYAHWRFLIIDDKAFIRFNIDNMLTRLGAKDVVPAANGEQGRGLLRKYARSAAGPIDCVISDWSMHPVGGLELLRCVRAGEIEGVPATTCFIMLTGHAAENVVRTAIALDANAYLAKPVTFEKLNKAIAVAMAADFTPKTADYYRSVQDPDIPPMLQAADVQPPPWMPEIADPPRRALFEERLRQIRTEAAAPCCSEPKSIRNTRRQHLSEISVGLVLAENIFALDRTPLLAAGTVITPSLLIRLKGICNDSAAELWVGDDGETTATAVRP